MIRRCQAYFVESIVAIAIGMNVCRVAVNTKVRAEWDKWVPVTATLEYCVPTATL